MITLVAGHFGKLTKISKTVAKSAEQANNLLEGGVFLA
jgi:hypothetical protein